MIDDNDRLRSFNNIAKLVKSRRLNHPKRYSQSELSALLGYKNGQFISNVERALCNVPLKMLTKIAEILGISHEELKKAILKDHEETLNNYMDKKKAEEAEGSSPFN
ncbi:MAG: XRE family transcriptional regulator [Deltaproteobacteria bacterium]|nr:MAG: XRE family transcriptional regulator [Deltaproteobacteria bacterium]TNF31336.1 MAG: XRE family transcriptional regulator [Deltaproteobacteria bacterium]